MYVAAVVVAGLDDFGVGLVDGGLLGEFLSEVAQGGVEGPVEEPAYEAEGEDIAALEDALVVEAAAFEGGLSHGCDGNLDDLGGDAELGEWIVGGEEGLAEVGFLE